MKLGYIGLGKMGKNMVLKLLDEGHGVVAYNRTYKKTEEVMEAGAEGVKEVEELVKKLEVPRVVWVMLPAGDPVQQMIEQLAGLLDKGDILIDGGNSNYKETKKRAKILAENEIEMLDAGVSGGPKGAREGACVMIGGKRGVYDQLKELFQSISAEKAFGHFGKSGAGHFVKMVHNGIEYGMMQAIGEGFEVLKESDYDLDLGEVSRVYNEKSVIESRLVGWLRKAYKTEGQELENISGSVSHSGEGQWTVEEAGKLGIPVPVIEGAFNFRKDSEKKPSYTGKVVSALRGEFGGHNVEKSQKQIPSKKT